MIGHGKKAVKLVVAIGGSIPFGIRFLNGIPVPVNGTTIPHQNKRMNENKEKRTYFCGIFCS
jgi:hypothetical protein